MYKIAVFTCLDNFMGYLDSYTFYHGEIKFTYNDKGKIYKRLKSAKNAIDKLKITGNYYFIIEDFEEVI